MKKILLIMIMVLFVIGCADHSNVNKNLNNKEDIKETVKNEENIDSKKNEGKYEVADIYDDEKFETFFKEFQNYVIENNAYKISEMLDDPLRINSSNESYEIKDKEIFIKNYGKIFSDKIKNAVINQKIETLFVNYQGVMIGSGEVWIGCKGEEEYFIIAINNDEFNMDNENNKEEDPVSSVFFTDYYMIGGTEDNKWVDSEELSKQIKGKDTTYKLYSFDEFIGEYTAKEVKGEFMAEEFGYSLKFNNIEQIKEKYLSINCNFNPLIRIPMIQERDIAVYEKEAQTIISSTNRTNVKAKVDKVIRIDIEGDGQEEAIVCASYYENKNSFNLEVGEKIEYSLVFLRKIIDGEIKIIILGENYNDNKENKVFERLDVPFVLDLNGDTKMEIVLDGFSKNTIQSINKSFISDSLSFNFGISKK